MATNNKGRPRKKIKPVWERGYNGHVYWLGKLKQGKVTLLSRADLDPRGKYRWDAGGRTGFTDQLDRARREVEMAVATKDRQLELFE